MACELRHGCALPLPLSLPLPLPRGRHDLPPSSYHGHGCVLREKEGERTSCRLQAALPCRSEGWRRRERERGVVGSGRSARGMERRGRSTLLGLGLGLGLGVSGSSSERGARIKGSLDGEKWRGIYRKKEEEEEEEEDERVLEKMNADRFSLFSKKIELRSEVASPLSLELRWERGGGREGGRGLPEEPLRDCDEFGPNFFKTLPEGVSFKDLLKHYRAVRAQIRSWSDYFFSQHGTRPSLKDVDNTGLPWLKKKFREYIDVRAFLEQAAQSGDDKIKYEEVQLLFDGMPAVSEKMLPIRKRVEMDFVDDWIDGSFRGDRLLGKGGEKSSYRRSSKPSDEESNGGSLTKQVRLNEGGRRPLQKKNSSLNGYDELTVNEEALLDRFLPSSNESKSERSLRDGRKEDDDVLLSNSTMESNESPTTRASPSSNRSLQGGLNLQRPLFRGGGYSRQGEASPKEIFGSDIGDQRRLMEAAIICWQSLALVGVTVSDSLSMLYILLYWACEALTRIKAGQGSQQYSLSPVPVYHTYSKNIYMGEPLK